MDRRDFLSGALSTAGFAGLSGIGIAKGVEGLSGTDSFDEIIAKMMDVAGDKFHKYMQNAHTPAGLDADHSCLDAVKQLVDASSLPSHLKKLTPYLTFVLSGCDPHTQKGDVKGLWALSSQEANGLIKHQKPQEESKAALSRKVDSQQSFGDKDARCSVKESTEHAIAHLAKMCDEVRNDPHYLKICSTYQFDPADNVLLAYATIMSFRRGSNKHVAAALNNIANNLNPEKHSTYDVVVQLGYFFKDVELDGEDERDRNFMSSLPFMAEAFFNLDNSIKAPTSQTIRGVMSGIAGAVVGISAGFITGKEGPRRQFLASLGGIVGLASGIGSSALMHQTINPPHLPNGTFDVEYFNIAVMGQEIKDLYYEYKGKNLFGSRLINTPQIENLIHPHDYHLSRDMGRTSYARYEYTSERKYLQLARYYFEKCQNLGPPKEEEPYIARALRVTRGKNKEQNTDTLPPSVGAQHKPL